MEFLKVHSWMLLVAFALGCTITYFIMRGLINNAKAKFFLLQDQFEKEEHDWQTKLDTEHSAFEKACKERDTYLREKEDLISAREVLSAADANLVPAVELDTLRTELNRVKAEREDFRRRREELSTELEKVLLQLENSQKLTESAAPTPPTAVTPPKPTMTPEMILQAQKENTIREPQFDWHRLEASLSPIVERLAEFDRKITSVEHKTHHFGDLNQELANLISAQKQVHSPTPAHHTENHQPQRTTTLLTAAPIAASRWLEKFGLNRGKDFFEKTPLDGASKYQDIFIRLPDEKSLYLDCHTVTHDQLSTVMQKESSVTRVCEITHRWIQDRKLTLSGGILDEEVASCEIKLILLPSEETYLEMAARYSDLMESPEGYKIYVISPIHLGFVCNFLSFVSRQMESQHDIEKILKLGRDLGLRVGKIIEAVDSVGLGLNQTVMSFNELMRSVDFHLISNLRKIEKMHTFDWPQAPLLSEDVLASPASSRNGERKPA